jgi:hypothetical protein
VDQHATDVLADLRLIEIDVWRPAARSVDQRGGSCILLRNVHPELAPFKRHKIRLPLASQLAGITVWMAIAFVDLLSSKR